MTPRVFVSSVFEGFQEMRRAARRGILAAGCEPVLVNEDFPAAPDSARNACLDAVESCDIFLIVIGSRGGWRAPSGKLVVEEELDHATAKGLPILVFLEQAERDVQASRLADRLTDYIDGFLRSTFATEADLQSAVTEALRKHGGAGMISTITGDNLTPDLNESRASQQSASLLFVLSPERDQEVVDLVRLEGVDFAESVYCVAHDRKTGLFSYEAPKEKGRTPEGVSFSQLHRVGTAKRARDVLLEIRPSGRLVIEQELGPLDGEPFWAGLVIRESDLQSALRSSISFAAEFYNLVDSYRRQTSFWYGTSIAHSEFRLLVKESPTGSAPIATRQRGKQPVLGEKPRKISRSDLASPAALIDRALTCYRRALGA